MDIEVYEGSKPTLKARCSHDPTQKTTFFTYSWKTGETLIYGEPGIESCDHPDCGCLIHLHDNKKIGKLSCPSYGR